MTDVQTTTQNVEAVVNEFAPVVGAVASAVVPGAGAAITTAEGALSAAETVANAVEANAPHNTALSDVVAGVQALAATPVVQSNATAAAHVSALASLVSAIESFFKGL